MLSVLDISGAFDVNRPKRTFLSNNSNNNNNISCTFHLVRNQQQQTRVVRQQYSASRPRDPLYAIAENDALNYRPLHPHFQLRKESHQCRRLGGALEGGSIGARCRKREWQYVAGRGCFVSRLPIQSDAVTFAHHRYPALYKK